MRTSDRSFLRLTVAASLGVMLLAPAWAQDVVPVPPRDIGESTVDVADAAADRSLGSPVSALAAFPESDTQLGPDALSATTALTANTALSASAAFSFDGGVSSSELLTALKGAADAGQPIALWRLAVMYENGDGVAPDPVQAFHYYSQIANNNADASPSSREADIIAQSFLKVGSYYMTGLPDAGVREDDAHARSLIIYAASYFGDAEAQFQAGELYLDDVSVGPNSVQAARWLGLAARKGHHGAQARLGDLLFNDTGIEGDATEGLTWLTLANRGAAGTSDEIWVRDLYERALSVADETQRRDAMAAADIIEVRIGS